MEPTNRVVHLCVQGMMAEGQGCGDVARRFFEQAWTESTDDFERCVAAHYLARQQSSPAEVLRWNREALNRADAVGDERVQGFYPSLYLNMGKSCEDFGARDEARRYYERARESAADLPSDGYGAMIRRGIAAGRRRTDAGAGDTPRASDADA